MSILILIEHNNKKISTASLSTITAAQQIGGEITALVTGHDISEVTKQVAKIDIINNVIAIDDNLLANNLAEDIAKIIVKIANNYTHILGNSSIFSKNILPRVAALLDVMQISDITAVINADTFERPIYSGGAITTVKSIDPIKVITVRATKFHSASVGNNTANTINNEVVSKNNLSKFIRYELASETGPDLATAKVIIAGGGGFNSLYEYENLLTPIAEKLNAELGATREIINLGLSPNKYLIGQSGKIVAPDLYVAVGISGALQHLAGIKDSKIIVAINDDPNAVIFKVADYGLVADLNTAIPELVEAL